VLTNTGQKLCITASNDSADTQINQNARTPLQWLKSRFAASNKISCRTVTDIMQSARSLVLYGIMKVRRGCMAYRPVTFASTSESDSALRSMPSCAGCWAGQSRMDSHDTATLFGSVTMH